MKEMAIAPISIKYSKHLWKWVFSQDNPEWKQWDAPYFEHHSLPYDEFCEKAENRVNRQAVQGIFVEDELIGTVSYYWECEKTRWLELGIVIFNPAYWNGGYGTEALRRWSAIVFHMHPQIERVGFTTWSGNKRMIAVGEKLGFSREARIRKVRYYQGVYYDSIRYGLTREEWNTRQNQR